LGWTFTLQNIKKEGIIALGDSKQGNRGEGGKDQIPSLAWDLVYMGEKMQRYELTKRST